MGFLRGGPIGAIVGGTVQHVLSKKIADKIKKNLPGVRDQGIFVTSLVVVLTKVGMTKGSVSSAEIRVLHQFFMKNLNYKTGDFKFINEVIAETQKVNPDLESFVAQYRKSSQNLYNLLLLALAYQVGLTGGEFSEATQVCINSLAGHLQVSYEEHDRLRNKYSLNKLKTPYSILGVKYSAGNEEIKKSYRKLVSLYHPDRVHGQGDDHMQEAHLKFLEIQAAYEELVKIRGF